MAAAPAEPAQGDKPKSMGALLRDLVNRGDDSGGLLLNFRTGRIEHKRVAGPPTLAAPVLPGPREDYGSAFSPSASSRGRSSRSRSRQRPVTVGHGYGEGAGDSSDSSGEREGSLVRPKAGKKRCNRAPSSSSESTNDRSSTSSRQSSSSSSSSSSAHSRRKRAKKAPRKRQKKSNTKKSASSRQPESKAKKSAGKQTHESHGKKKATATAVGDAEARAAPLAEKAEPVRVMLAKMGEACCEVTAERLAGSVEVATEESRWDMNQRTSVERCRLHLEQAGGFSGAQSAAVLWKLIVASNSEAPAYAALSAYLIDKGRVGLVNTPGSQVYIVPPHEPFHKHLNLDETDFLVGVQVPRLPTS